MLKKFASDTFGLSDIGKIIDPADFGKTDVDDYILNEDDEKIYFVIKSKQDEYCFTNQALIHLDGDSAVSSKRRLNRYDYLYNAIDEVTLETAGKIDLDVEIKFLIGGEAFNIDVDKNQIEKLKDLYKALIAISIIQDQNKAKFAYVASAQDVAATFLGRSSNPNTMVTFEALRDSSMNFMLEKHEEYNRKDFGDVFEKYIYN